MEHLSRRAIQHLFSKVLKTIPFVLKENSRNGKMKGNFHHNTKQGEVGPSN
jgi:hypothetical protein